MNVSVVLFFAAVASSATAAQMRTINACILEDGSEATLLAQHDPEQDADKIYISMDGNTKSAFADLQDADFAGEIVLSKCLDHVLIFAINYGAPYTKGVVLRRTAEDRTTQRIDFSEKALPELLYLGKRETKVVIPNVGHEVSSKYLVYRFRISQGQDEEAAALNSLPPKDGFKVLQLQQ